MTMPQLLNDFLLRQYALGDCVWAGITRLLITAVDAAACTLSYMDRNPWLPLVPKATLTIRSSLADVRSRII